jgi:hypothetical protein
VEKETIRMLALFDFFALTQTPIASSTCLPEARQAGFSQGKQVAKS